MFVSDGLSETNKGDAFYNSGNPFAAADYTGGANLDGYTRVFYTSSEKGKDKWKSPGNNFIQDGDILALRRSNGTSHLAIATGGGTLSVGAGRDAVGKANKFMHNAAHGKYINEGVIRFAVWRKNK